MARFLHIADVHLGFDHYDSRTRTKDFYLALKDVLEKHAIAAKVDFVVVAGDLFEHRMIQPAILGQAKDCFEMVKDAGIPVIAIEGNHDNRPYGTRTNWLRYLADDGLMTLLEPSVGDEGVVFDPWDGMHGGYIDLDCGVRVYGSAWYGSSAPRAIESLAAAIERVPAHEGQTVMLFHHGLEGQIARYQGALRYDDLLPLKEVGVDYLGLGHIHKNYEVEGWIFNPGSLEANNIQEADFERGAYLVEISAEGIKAELKRDYYQRSIVRLRHNTNGQESLEDLEQAALGVIQKAIKKQKLKPEDEPIVELRIEGKVGFDRLDLDTRKLQQELKEASGALIFLFRYNVEATEYQAPLIEDANRSQIESEVFTDLLTAHNSYKKRAAQLAQGLIELKDMNLKGETEEDLYDHVVGLLDEKN
ncbi:DNA repair exonuclease [filamentous cyanobacterium LEGE 11480]|uniref:Nuclease SbcCD subunit D n=1 Tax=Romeriopsis navalis LEGE 11480 TaxID=2777977 RepID=A0A928Z1U3_9CYAN|nr:DNA repair exonuclease [Romeriopsis navalis]MBE9029701.1 DNA repair exonuclease [Romeriopsis navalis LEGE 11480]